jgi:hypothetical protein
MLISDTVALRRLFPAGTVFVDSADPQAIASGMKRLFAQHATLTQQVNDFRQQLERDWLNVHSKHLSNRIAAART